MKMWIVFEIVLRAVAFGKKCVFFLSQSRNSLLPGFELNMLSEEMGKRKSHRRFGKPCHSI